MRALFQGKDAILSGPAGGIVGMVRTAAAGRLRQGHRLRHGRHLDRCRHYAGEFERAFETEVAGVRMRAPMMSIHTVAAGGGSILQLRRRAFRVGPESAGANPGPACYRRGGPLTVTDCNVMLGKLQPDHFPHVFGPDGDQPLDADVVRARSSRTLAEAVAQETGEAPRSPEEVAEGFLRIAVENMANAIKKISVQRGYDVTGYTLQLLRRRRRPARLPGGRRAGHAKRSSCIRSPACCRPTAWGWPTCARCASAQVEPAAATRPRMRRPRSTGSSRSPVPRSPAQGVRRHRDRHGAHRAYLRYDGRTSHLALPLAPLTEMRAGFEAAHRQRFGFVSPDRELIIDLLSAEAIGATGDAPADAAAGDAPTARTATPPACTVGGGWHDVPIVRRATRMATGQTRRRTRRSSSSPPAPTWSSRAGRRQASTARQPSDLRRIRGRGGTRPSAPSVDPVMLEVFNNLFMSIAEQMGATLANTAYSVNIKERLRFLLRDLRRQHGDLIANAPHMPVHLGSMSDSVRTVIRAERGQDPAGRRLHAQRPYQRRHPPARRDGHHAGLR